MQRRLIVMRHAKSAWNTDAPTDHARPLNKRGRRDAPRIGARLVELGWAPELALSSDSERTKQTWKLASSAFGRLPVSFLPAFYAGDGSDVRAALAHVPADTTTVLVLGHNPGWEDLVAELSGEDLRFTTANAALFVTEADSWAAAAEPGQAWKMQHLLRPKEL